jgi:hypothetical protein
VELKPPTTHQWYGKGDGVNEGAVMLQYRLPSYSAQSTQILLPSLRVEGCFREASVFPKSGKSRVSSVSTARDSVYWSSCVEVEVVIEADIGEEGRTTGLPGYGIGPLQNGTARASYLPHHHMSSNTTSTPSLTTHIEWYSSSFGTRGPDPVPPPSAAHGTPALNRGSQSTSHQARVSPREKT